MNQVFPSPLIRLIQEQLPWFSILINVVGVAVAAAYLKRSRWTLLILFAFLAEAAIQVGSKVLVPTFVSGNYLWRIQTFFALTSVLGAMQRAALVVGIAGVLSDLAKSSRTSPLTPIP
jgi:hypothetical protein